VADFRSSRAVLLRIAAIAGIIGHFLCGASLRAEDSAALVEAWLSQARIAGAELFSEMTEREIAQSVSALAEQNVSVIEADSDLSRLLTEKEFEAEIALMRRYCEAAHRLGMRVVWYYPALEVLTPNAKLGNRSMYQMHPEWVQIGLDGKANVFYGKRGSRARVHWVDPNAESAWMSPHTPYADMFIERVKRVAGTGVDGIWLDVPIYNDIAVSWADTGPGAAAKFHADTGMDVPKQVNWDDPVWRRWIAWRHAELSSFILRVRDAARSVANDITTIVETVTLDYDSTTILGLDGSTMKRDSGLIQVWEADAISDRTGMRGAKPDDWISLIGMSKFAKAASGKKPSWIFAYGKEPDDGLLVMAEALAAGNHPYETKIPLMTTTVGAAYRKRMFSWIKQQEQRLFASESAAKVAVYCSPESRDYVDKGAGSGLFATTKAEDAWWWSREREDSVYSLLYLAEYRGMIKWLTHNHVPFDIVVRPDALELSRYRTVIAPALTAISNEDADLLDSYVAAGGNLIVTGPNPAMLDSFGNTRGSMALKTLLGREHVSALPSPSAGGGAAIHIPELLGKTYLTSGSASASQAISARIADYVHSPIETNADKDVHVELRISGNEMLLHLVNPVRLWNRSAPIRRNVTVRMEIPPGVRVAGVELTTPEVQGKSAANEMSTDLSAQARKTSHPDRARKKSREATRVKSASHNRGHKKARLPAADKDEEPLVTGKLPATVPAKLPYTVDGGQLSFTVPLAAYDMVVISTIPQ
jgi:hypothetical protein